MLTQIKLKAYVTIQTDTVNINELTYSLQTKISLKQNVLTKFHEEKIVPPPVFRPTGTIFEIFYEDPTINVASRENAPPPGGHVFQANGTIFEFVQDTIRTNLQSKLHVAARMLTRFYYSHI
ncbi:hypothetical protein DPMN_089069 [Dreissena polymorpha]|uniref:Uncharacterized protein n=1 Tax=Dreissena polymorpha TaxID=45954 RepID=A0A9D4QXP8_DREPO|nr:hypothetical protein DPMN_089069 [Dreissena polymorpha]